jgi:hypothetical protein
MISYCEACRNPYNPWSDGNGMIPVDNMEDYLCFSCRDKVKDEEATKLTAEDIDRIVEEILNYIPTHTCYNCNELPENHIKDDRGLRCPKAHERT